jgi:hypothetical protein
MIIYHQDIKHNCAREVSHKSTNWIFEETNVKSLSLRRLELLSESNSNEDENSSDGCRHERLVCRVKKSIYGL